ncbi:hypothetical protein LCGC14_1183110 [marine sediment metagenome]|uniref:Uncharacterized protein n=1 Tax=marine sediment metagenome TaxID=412755 RepID=A0A0F9P4E5_9ZZZZ
MKKLLRDFYLNCNSGVELQQFVWEIMPIILKIKEKYFRILNNGIPSWELDYRLKTEE